MIEFPVSGRFKFVVIRQFGNWDEARVAQGLPKERGAFSAEHDDLGEIISQTELSPKVLIKLLPVSIFTQAGPILEHTIHLQIIFLFSYRKCITYPDRVTVGEAVRISKQMVVVYLAMSNDRIILSNLNQFKSILYIIV